MITIKLSFLQSYIYLLCLLIFFCIVVDVDAIAPLSCFTIIFSVISYLHYFSSFCLCFQCLICSILLLCFFHIFDLMFVFHIILILILVLVFHFSKVVKTLYSVFFAWNSHFDKPGWYRQEICLYTCWACSSLICNLFSSYPIIVTIAFYLLALLVVLIWVDELSWLCIFLLNTELHCSNSKRIKKCKRYCKKNSSSSSRSSIKIMLCEQQQQQQH